MPNHCFSCSQVRLLLLSSLLVVQVAQAEPLGSKEEQVERPRIGSRRCVG